MSAQTLPSPLLVAPFKVWSLAPLKLSPSPLATVSLYVARCSSSSALALFLVLCIKHGRKLNLVQKTGFLTFWVNGRWFKDAGNHSPPPTLIYFFCAKISVFPGHFFPVNFSFYVLGYNFSPQGPPALLLTAFDFGMGSIRSRCPLVFPLASKALHKTPFFNTIFFIT